MSIDINKHEVEIDTLFYYITKSCTKSTTLLKNLHK